MMAEEKKAVHTVPSDAEQVPIVWRYELLKYLRSWRLLASIGIAVLVLTLIYVIPPALGHPYSGTDSDQTLSLVPAGAFQVGGAGGPVPVAAAVLDRSNIDSSSVAISLNGTAYPSADGANWFVSDAEYGGQTVWAVFFVDEVSNYTVTATYDWQTSPESFAGNFLGFAGLLVVICATFFGADSLVGEFQNRTGYLIFPNPLKRWVLYAGKFAASMTAGGIVIFLFYAGIGVLSLVSAGGVDDDFPLSLGFAVLYLLAATAAAYLISTVLKGTTGATVLTFFLFVMIMPIIDGISSVAGTKLQGSLTFAAGVISYILSDPYPTDSSQTLPGGMSFSSYYPDPGVAAVVMLVYAAVAIGLSMYLFKRKQLAG
jgi:ABC-type transport system involved in multi-copper enzyme maturation permease subunit